MAVDVIGDGAELRLEIVDGDVGHAPRGIPVEGQRFPQHRAGAARDRVGDERAAVGSLSRERRERIARAHVPAVGGDAARRARASRASSAATSKSERERRRRHVSSRIAAPASGRITLSPGASGGTPSVRSADPITVENTGAATSPP